MRAFGQLFFFLMVLQRVAGVLRASPRLVLSSVWISRLVRWRVPAGGQHLLNLVNAAGLCGKPGREAERTPQPLSFWKLGASSLPLRGLAGALGTEARDARNGHRAFGEAVEKNVVD